MPKPKIRAYSGYTEEAIQLMSSLIREGRLERKMTAQEVADRAGISRGLLQRIEKGDLKCEIGATFEVAWVVGVSLFGIEEEAKMRFQREQSQAKLALMPKSIRSKNKQVKDDF